MLHDIEHTLRASFFGFTAMLPLIAAGTVDANPSVAEIFALVLLALNYHCFGYLHNDLVDLPVDRTEPQRANDPLVTGRLNVTHARLFVLAQFPMTCLVVWLLDGTPAVWGYLIFAYACGYLYNIYGKRCRVPMFTDALQGVGWFCFAMLGASLLGTPRALTFVIAFFGFAFIFLINGVHGGLRDLSNDLRRGRTTTAIYLGARPTAGGDALSTPALQAFAIFAFTLVVFPFGYCLATNAFHYPDGTLSAIVVTWLAFTGGSVWYLWQVVKTHQTERRRWIYAHQLFLLAPPLVVFLPSLAWSLRVLVLAIWGVTLFFFSEPIARMLRGVMPLSRRYSTGRREDADALPELPATRGLDQPKGSD